MKWIGCILALMFIPFAAHFAYNKNRVFEATQERLDESYADQQQALSEIADSLANKSDEIKTQIAEQEAVAKTIEKERDQVRKEAQETEQAIAELEEKIEHHEVEIDESEHAQDRALTEMEIMAENMRDTEADIRVLREVLRQFPSLE